VLHYNHVGAQITGRPLNKGEIQLTPIKVQKGPGTEQGNAIRSFSIHLAADEVAAANGHPTTTGERNHLVWHDE
jgi:hypothetical protein